MPHIAYWKGQIRISLVQFSISLQTATRRAAQMPLHEYDRVSGERIHHQDITEDGKIIKDQNIVKGYEVAKNDIVMLEDDDLKSLKLPSSDVLEIDQFVLRDEIPSYYLERPYYVLPEGKGGAEIYQTLHEALREANKVGIGQLAIRGREELCALMAIEEGLLLQTLRYPAELVAPNTVFKDLKKAKVKADYTKLAEQLIEQNSAKLNLGGYHDHYHEALAALVDAKKHHRKIKATAPTRSGGKVINFMDALKKSLNASPKKTRTAKTGKTSKAAKRKAS